MALREITNRIRQISDELFEAGEFDQASLLLKASNPLESVAIFVDETNRDHVPFADIKGLYENTTHALLQICQAQLPASTCAEVQDAINANAIAAIEDHDYLARLETEVRQVEHILGLAIDDRDLSGIRKLGQMLATKYRLLTREQVKTGFLINQTKTNELIDHSSNPLAEDCKRIMGDDAWSKVVDELLERMNDDA